MCKINSKYLISLWLYLSFGPERTCKIIEKSMFFQDFSGHRERCNSLKKQKLPLILHATPVTIDIVQFNAVRRNVLCIVAG